MKPRNPQDATLRNIRTTRKHLAALRTRVTILERAVKALQKGR